MFLFILATKLADSNRYEKPDKQFKRIYDHFS